MKAELKTRMSNSLKTLIKANAKASGMNTSAYARYVLKNAGVLKLSKIKTIEDELSLKERQEKLLQKAKLNESSK